MQQHSVDGKPGLDITWNKHDLVLWCHMASPGNNVSTFCMFAPCALHDTSHLRWTRSISCLSMPMCIGTARTLTNVILNFLTSPVILHHWKMLGVNSLRPRQNRRHFADNDFKCNFLSENVWIPIKISLKFVPKGPINNIPALVQIMAWCGTGESHYLTNDDPVQRSIYASLGLNELMPQWLQQIF